MLNEKLKNKNKNVRGATVPVALSRRPYPLPRPASWTGKGAWASYPQGKTLVVHAGLWITHACKTSVLFMRWITLPRLNIIDVVLSRLAFTSGLTLIVKLVSANLRMRVIVQNLCANRITHPTNQRNGINTHDDYQTKSHESSHFCLYIHDIAIVG